MSDIKPIRTQVDHKAALKEIEQLWDAKPGSREADRLEALAILVEAYEKKRFPIAKPDPISAIEFRIEQLGLDRKALEPAIGSRARVKDILDRKRSLTLSMIRRLNKQFNISLDVLAQPTVAAKPKEKRHVRIR